MRGAPSEARVKCVNESEAVCHVAKVSANVSARPGVANQQTLVLTLRTYT